MVKFKVNQIIKTSKILFSDVINIETNKASKSKKFPIYLGELLEHLKLYKLNNILSIQFVDINVSGKGLLRLHKWETKKYYTLCVYSIDKKIYKSIKKEIREIVIPSMSFWKKTVDKRKKISTGIFYYLDKDNKITHHIY